MGQAAFGQGRGPPFFRCSDYNIASGACKAIGIRKACYWTVNMKKVLMIAHQFPPIGGSGVQRTVKFIKYLPDFGWKGAVFTRQAQKAELTDKTLNSDIPPDTVILRSAAWDLSEWPFPLNLAGKYLRRKVLVPDGERLWELFARKKAIQRAKPGQYDYAFSSSQPFSTTFWAMEKKALAILPGVDLRGSGPITAFVKAMATGVQISWRSLEKRPLNGRPSSSTRLSGDNSVRDYPG